MNLRTQMLLAGALTLAIPVLGWQSVKQLDASLKQTRIDTQTLQVANARVALAEDDRLQSILARVSGRQQPGDLYAETSTYPLILDGYPDDWHALKSRAVRLSSDSGDATASARLRLARRADRLWLFISIEDDDVRYHVPPLLRADAGEGEIPDPQERLVNGDALEFLVAEPDGGQRRHGVLRAIAPGPLDALLASSSAERRRTVGSRLPGVRAFWVATNRGLQLEVDMPMPAIGSIFGVAYVDVDDRSAARNRWLGTLDPDSMRSATALTAPRLLSASGMVEDRLRRWVTPGVRARLFDRQGNLMADVNQLYDKSDEQREHDPARGSLFNALLFRLFAYSVSEPAYRGDAPMTLRDGLHLTEQQRLAQEPQTRRYLTTERDTVLGTLVPVGGDETNGFLLMESNEELATAYAGSRLARLFSLLTLASLLAGGVLLVYASVLSLRIRRLSQQAQQAVADDGRVVGLPGSDARDEIGDLSRNLSALLARSANYTRYLEALSSRLSHELRTPLSVVKTSIENMDRERLDAQTQVLLDRASGGADQLGAIIRALVESTRLEQTVQRADMHRIDLTAWILASVERYRQIYPQMNIRAVGSRDFQELSDVELWLRVAPELLQQAMDKLVDNAVSFSLDGDVLLLLEQGVDRWGSTVTVAVANRGEAIDKERLPRLFDPMYSERDEDDGHLHLGLGLYIVRMIGEAHGGRAFATSSDSHVLVGMQLPLHRAQR